VLEGSVRKASQRVRITGQLIDATSGTHLWADRFDGSLEDVFDLQDKVASSVAGVIEPTLRQAEIERARRKRPDSLDAYDLYLRALPFAYTSMPEDAEKALGYLEQAIKLEPDFAVAHAIIAWCQEQRYLRGGLHKDARAIALRHARLAIAMGGDDATALAIAGLVIGFLEPRDYDVAVSAFDRSLALSNSSALALGFSAVTRAWHGESTIAIEQAEQALRLSPLFDPLSKERHMAIAIAHFVAGRFEESTSAASRAIQANPRFSPPYWMRCAALASLGRIDEAEAVGEQLLKVQPQFTIGSIISAPFAKREILGALGDALRRVGLPE
jgi:adenylate cyclase